MPFQTLPKIIPKIVPVTPMEIYLLQIKGTFDNIRAERREMDYIPPQFGGPYGQLDVLNEVVTLEIIDFEVQ
jgi:hypothetical protein